MSPADPDTASRVTPVEVFFDVVFVFTVTQLAHVLCHRHPAAVAHPTAMLLVDRRRPAPRTANA